MSSVLTATDIIAPATECLSSAGYSVVKSDKTSAWTQRPARLFEDPYSVVGVVVFDTWADLSEGWGDAQAGLVESMSAYVGRAEPKAWDGYLALFTPAILPREETARAQSIRYDTTRLRKLLATGSDLTTLAAVRDTLLPLLPVREHSTPGTQGSALDALPRLLGKRGFEERTIRGLIRAFRDQHSLMDALHGKGKP
jgi:hypothetical protein